MDPKFQAYYTHQKYLTGELDKLDYSKPVLVAEFGTGDGSSSIFQEYARKYITLKIDSFETDIKWFNSMKGKYPVDNYNFNFVGSWDNLISKEYDLAFVDNGPDFAARIKVIDLIKNKTKVIILHDYDFYNKGVIEDIFSVSKGSFFEKYNKKFVLKGYHEILPPTLIMTRI
jgi:hypothetical protein